MKIAIVTGGRDYTDRAKVAEALREHGPFDQLWHGGARGADTLAADCAHALGLQTVCFSANWDKFGNGAGMRRNAQMMAAGAELKAAGGRVVEWAVRGGVGAEHAKSQAVARQLRVVDVEV